jgi:hypothetical protein
MKRVINFLICGAIVLGVQVAQAQNIDEERMKRDIAVAENVLNTLIKQEFGKRSFFPVEVRGSYRAGYGVTFSIPTEMLLPMVWGGQNDDFVVLDGAPGAFSYSYSWSDDEETEAPERAEVKERKEQPEKKEQAERKEKRELKEVKEKTEIERSQKEMEKAEMEMRRAEEEMERANRAVTITMPARARYRERNTDSLRMESNKRIMKAAKDFIADYGDMISQLGANEKIIITNQGENKRWYFRENEKRSILSVEALKSDLTQFRQGKINRDQLLAKIKVTNTESSGKVEPDLELLTSIFNRLYRNDLSKSFFIEGGAYYERLVDFGAIVYMQVYSSNQVSENRYNMPTVGLRDVDQAERDKKVKELYPVFENELKENILDYGRTLKSLNDNEQLVFNVKLTRCKGCGIPSDIEVAVKSSVLKDYNSGKLDKNAALSKITVKKGANQ